MNMIAEVLDPMLGKLREAGLSIKYGLTPGAITRSAPQPGADTEAVLRGLGIDQAELAEMRARSAIEEKSR
jgi:crotonobetainyl-CoA:carnitine CoA-transferase CaiB-like acyl-CoA transferase